MCIPCSQLSNKCSDCHQYKELCHPIETQSDHTTQGLGILIPKGWLRGKASGFSFQQLPTASFCLTQSAWSLSSRQEIYVNQSPLAAADTRSYSMAGFAAHASVIQAEPEPWHMHAIPSCKQSFPDNLNHSSGNMSYKDGFLLPALLITSPQTPNVPFSVL